MDFKGTNGICDLNRRSFVISGGNGEVNLDNGGDWRKLRRPGSEILF